MGHCTEKGTCEVTGWKGMERLWQGCSIHGVSLSAAGDSEVT